MKNCILVLSLFISGHATAATLKRIHIEYYYLTDFGDKNWFEHSTDAVLFPSSEGAADTLNSLDVNQHYSCEAKFSANKLNGNYYLSVFEMQNCAVEP